MYGVGGEKLAHLCTAARQTPEDPLIPKAVLERTTKRQAESETRAERDQSWVPIEMLPVALTPAQYLFFSASPFHRQNTEAQGAEEKHLIPDGPAKRVSRGGTRPQNFQIQPSVNRLRRGAVTGGMRKTGMSREVSSQRNVRRQMWSRLEEEQSRGASL